MESHQKENSFVKTLLWSLGIATILSVILSWNVTVFALNENQLLYLFSAMAQVIAGLFGLTLTAYIFFADKFKESTIGDDTLYDATSSLLKRYFRILAMLATICGTVILLCILGIVDLYNWMNVYSFIINEAVLIFLIGIVAILAFGAILLDPMKLDRELQRMKQEVEQLYKSPSQEETGNFLEFLKNYNLLEQLIMDFANACTNVNKVFEMSYTYNRKPYKPQIIQSLKILNAHEIINGTLLDEINKLRIYRNGLVHGVDFSITQSACNRIAEIYKSLKYAYDILAEKGTDSEEWTNAINQIYDLTR